jgi:DNA-binding MarR family transcriptional regulator
LVVLVRQVVGLIDSTYAREVGTEGASMEDLLLLAWLAEAPGLGAADLAWRVGRHRQVVQRALQRLERAGRVERYGSCVSGRTVGWALTEGGHRALEHGRRVLEHLERGLRDPFARVDEQLIRQVLGRCVEALRGASVRETALWVPPAEAVPPKWDL